MDLENNTMEAIEKIGNTPDKLIEVLIQCQSLNQQNYITEEQLNLISKGLNIPLSKAYGVASFYSMLSTSKKGKYVIQVCNSGPCYVNNSKTIAKAFQDALGISLGEVTADGLFSLEYTSCFGGCQIAPAVKINDMVYGNLTEEKVWQLVDSLRKEAV
ncbi:NAD(P)H-dependent oxidoreductase subunit E [Alkaliphilus pronyensis]|uniref:NAD(P)H-dependent oxidoreductase subunit E n=1 Tax=Alkaliphilus pronyensis TaxID=1482732 RepID=A0A6I0F8P7_9FIRM|nr:NAD(P)H-dependent oxidoreductase subunit E [Alkaliphilus pronyensis]KAB3534883.1 NAD(P)H-dependent oxidoreductase subunit E [Alkaliphilus pronyensis]